MTELITGIDLVRAQLLVASREPLPESVLNASMGGHAIEVRLYAEDAAAGFLPQTGRLHRFAVPSGVRVDSGVEDGSDVSIHYDPMLAKVIAHAATRNEAAGALALALQRAHIHGVITNRDLLVSILRHDEFLAGETDTHFLERHDPGVLADRTSHDAVRRHLVAAALSAQASSRAQAAVLPNTPSGWRNNPSQPQARSFDHAGAEVVVRYEVGRNGVVRAWVDGDEVHADRCTASPSAVTIEEATVRRTYAVHWVDDDVFVDGPDGSSHFVAIPRFAVEDVAAAAGSLVSPMPGKIVSVAVDAGDAVTAGQVLVIVEAMKMEHSVRAPFGGHVVSVHVSGGDQVDGNQLLVVIDEDH